MHSGPPVAVVIGGVTTEKQGAHNEEDHRSQGRHDSADLGRSALLLRRRRPERLIGHIALIR